MYQRRFFRRIALYQECVGNVLDLSSRDVLADVQGPDVEVQREPVAGGTAVDTRRTHVVEIPIVTEEVSRLAHIMQELSQAYGHRVRMVAMSPSGGSHLVWSEPSALSVQPASRPFRDIASEVVRLETRVYHASIAQGSNLLAPVPWEGASTPGATTAAYGIASMGSEVAITNEDTDTIWVYDAWDGHSVRTLDAGLSGIRDVHYYEARDELWVVDEQALHIVDPVDGSVYGSVTTKDGASNALAARGVTSLDSTLYLLDVNDVLRSAAVPSRSASSVAATVENDAGTGLEGLTLAASGSSLWMMSGTGLDAKTALTSYTPGGSRSSASFTPGRGIGFVGGNLAAVTAGGTTTLYDGTSSSTLGTSDLTGPQPLRVRDGVTGRPERGYYGPTWTAEHACRVDITGLPDVVSESEPITLQMPLPASGATVRLEGATSALDALDFQGQSLPLRDPSRLGDPAELTLDSSKYEPLGIDQLAVWSLQVQLRAVTEQPGLVVVDPGRPLGSLRGGYSSTCVTVPAWGEDAVEVLEMPVTAEADSDLQVEVFGPDLTGVSGVLSDDGEAAQGTGTVVTYEQAGDYIPELVGTDLSDVTTLLFSHPRNPGTTSAPGYKWHHPTDLQVLPGLTGLADRSKQSDVVYDFQAISEGLANPKLIETVGATAPNGGSALGNETESTDIKDDILDPMEPAILLFRNWGSINTRQRHPTSILTSRTYLREVDFGEGWQFFTDRNVGNFPSSMRYINAGSASWGPANDRYLRDWVRLQFLRFKEFNVTPKTYSGVSLSAFLARVHLARYPAEVKMSRGASHVEDVRDGTGDFAHSYESDDGSSTIRFVGDLRSYQHTIDGVTFSDDAFPDPTNATTTDPDGNPLWQDSDPSYTKFGTLQETVPAERIFMVVDDAGDTWMMSTTAAGTVESGPVTAVTLGAAKSGYASIWRPGEDRTAVSYTLSDPLLGSSTELRDGLIGAGLIV